MIRTIRTSLRESAALAPDFLFSFYYRRMLKPPLLQVAPRGALNMHGSLLPRYRGRAPVNWAVLNGERHTGATLHYMDERPDAGDIVAAQSVPILPDDTAREVFDKVTVAAEICLDACFPALVAGTAPRTAATRSSAGRISAAARRRTAASTGRSQRTVDPRPRARGGAALPRRAHDRRRPAGARPAHARARRRSARRRTHARPSRRRRGHDWRIAGRDCGGGGTLRIDALEIDGERHTPAMVRARFGDTALPLG